MVCIPIKVVVPSISKIEVAVLFHPSTIGYEGHEVNLTFTSDEVS